MQPRPQHGFHPVFCTIVPPHVLDKLSQADDPGLSGPARRTLEGDAARRTRRQMNTLVPSVPTVATRTESDRPERILYDCRHGTQLPGFKVRSEGEQPTQDASVNRAYAGLGATFELLLTAYGRRSIDGNGLPLIGSVHYDEQYNNAFFDGEQMVFGDGDGEIFLDFTVAIDVIGHELTHGLTQYTANLSYFGQSGALNESMSDVFGSLVKQYSLGQTADQADWLIGAGLLAPGSRGGAALDEVAGNGVRRRCARQGPAARVDGGLHPHHRGQRRCTSELRHPEPRLLPAGHGARRQRVGAGGRLWFDVLTGDGLAGDADFSDFARLTVEAAKDRYGEGDELEAVRKAWSEVGVPSA